MGVPIIEVRNLSKHYFIGHKGAWGSYKRLSEIIVDYARHPVESIRGARSKKEEIWALKDVSFNVDKGEVIGLIGRNGAGKTTVLKIMSKITYPTAGEIILRGRVGSLLEVGTGFHPELTGRENIYMSGAILGMRKVEIERNFEDIVKFAEVEKFLDTPVKRYSSGMYVR
ncbi:MAG: ATP-binding cassette domain-containing protein, partial [Methanomassiliicoccales archaeon]|nr:ATP-binding cassette domain-containing protein [Methanomassiliicoccales archaeon]